MTSYDDAPAAARDGRRSTTTRCCCPAWSTPTCTSTSPAAPSGRGSPPRPGPPRPAGSPRSSTCRSTRSRRRRRSRQLRDQATGGRGAGLRRRRLLGRRGARQPARPRRRCTTRGCSASSASCSTRASRSSATSSRRQFALAMEETARLGALMIVHAEDGHLLDESALDGAHYAGLPRLAAARRPRRPRSSWSSTRRRETGGRAHVVHLSDARRRTDAPGRARRRAST